MIVRCIMPRLTRRGGEPILVNPLAVSIVEGDFDQPHCLIRFLDGTHAQVKESMSEVQKILGGCEQGHSP